MAPRKERFAAAIISQLPRDILRVFPRKTTATPDDLLAFVGPPPLDSPRNEHIKAVHISCTFTWDKQEAEALWPLWSKVYPGKVKLGGPAYDDPGGEFTPGMYIKPRFLMTSRGCPNKCSFCLVPPREGCIRELEVKQGWDVSDNNFTATSRDHQKKVFAMLKATGIPPFFGGGLEAALVTDWLVDQMADIKTRMIKLAYDHPANKEAVYEAVKKFQKAGFPQRIIGCYALVGYRNDTPEAAHERLKWLFDIGTIPFAMYYRGPNDPKTIPNDWKLMIRFYSTPAAMFSQKTRDPNDPFKRPSRAKVKHRPVPSYG